MKNGVLTLKKVNRNTKLYLKITYAVEDEEEDKYQLKTAYQCISLTGFSFEASSVGTYRLYFNREYLKESPLVREEDRNDMNGRKSVLKVQSYDVNEWSETFKCVHCGGKALEMRKEIEQFKDEFEFQKSKTTFKMMYRIPYLCSQCK